MIIFGTRSMESVRSTGTFNCPRCGRLKPYRHKSVNRWFTLYFIPVIPMGSAGTYVQCGACGATYGEAVLSYDPEAETRQLYLKLRGLLMLVAMADGTPPDADDCRASARPTRRRPARRCRPTSSRATCATPRPATSSSGSTPGNWGSN